MSILAIGAVIILATIAGIFYRRRKAAIVEDEDGQTDWILWS